MEGTEETREPQFHTERIEKMLEDVIQHCREDVGRVDCMQAKALFETTAEVLAGLKKAYEHYDSKSEPAFQKT